jgi:uncharacterized membrane protein (UPF0127 family)
MLKGEGLMNKLVRYKIGLLLILFISSIAHASEVITIRINHHPFRIEVPHTAKEYDQGLMYRHSMPKSSGMIFLFDKADAQHAVMWMKNTYIPLDMLFIGPDKRIVCIIQHTTPLSLKKIKCKKSVLAVIELNAGEVKQFNLAKGLKIEAEFTKKL